MRKGNAISAYRPTVTIAMPIAAGTYPTARSKRLGGDFHGSYTTGA